jgi:LPXTG-site transpeptidase (sortase) family protein
MPANLADQQGEPDGGAPRGQPWPYDAYGQGTSDRGAPGSRPWPYDAYGQGTSERDAYGQGTSDRGTPGSRPWPYDAYGQGSGEGDADSQATGERVPDGQGGGQRGARHVSGVRVIRRPWAVVAALAGVIVLCAGAAGLVWASHTARPATPLGPAPLVAIPAGHIAAVPPAEATTVPRPTALVIPAIGVRTRLIRLGVTATGALQVPASIAVAGWYTGSPRPGATGSSVIAGHIDSVSGPGVFFRLRELHPGDLVYVQRGHASMAVFTVTAVQLVPKSEFPTNEVYAPVPNAQLRLITCGGTFDSATGHYLSNVIVYAVLR